MECGVELPIDIIEKEILPRLPAKCVVRLKRVCKQWLSLISSKHFAKMHLHHIHQSADPYKHQLLMCDWRSYTYRIYSCVALNYSLTKRRSMPFIADPDDVKILATLDGLVCVGIERTNQLVFWNPLTRVYKNLSKTNSPRFFDPKKDAIGFYLDSSNDDYKLLQVVSSGRLGAYIYSNKSDSWRKIQCFENHPRISKCRWSQATYVGETLYFVVRDASIIGGQSWIVSFDVKSEKFREIKFPPIPSGTCFCESLVVVDGGIHLCVSYANGISLHELNGFPSGRSGLTSLAYSAGDLWRMEGDDDMWVKVATFSRAQHNLIKFNHLCVTRNGNWLMIAEYNNRLRKLNLEDLATNVCINFHGNWASSIPRTIFVETLVSPNP